MKKNDRNIVIFLLLVLGWMVLIFCLSAQNADQSSGLSGGVLRFFLKCIGITDSAQMLRIRSVLHLLVRKGGHFTEYMVLSILLMGLFSSFGFSKIRQGFFSAAVSLLYAVSDEIHQLFVSGRCGTVKDVAIDFAGALFGILFAVLWKKLRSWKRSGKTTEQYVSDSEK